MKIPVVFLLDEFGEAGTVHPFCSKQCREMFELQDGIETLAEGWNYAWGEDPIENHLSSHCIQCGKIVAPKPRGKELSFWALIFLLDRTDFSEPWMGIGFATQFQDKLIAMAWEKTENDDIRIQAVELHLQKLGFPKDYKGNL